MAGDAELPGTTTTYYVADQVGSSRMMLTAGGWPVSMDTYYPFGAEPYSAADQNHYKFSGKERDAESGNDNFGARYYSSAMGRFLTPDFSDAPQAMPYADLGNPQSFNRYVYENNNPLGGIDPDGHSSEGSNGQPCGFYGTFLNTNTGLASPAQVPCSSPGGGDNGPYSADNGESQQWADQIQWAKEYQSNPSNFSGNAKSGSIYKAFALGSQYGEESIGSDDQKAVDVRHVGFTYNVQILGDALDDTKASSAGWRDPMTSFHSGAESFYFGGPSHLLGFNAGHVAAGAGRNARPGLEAHHDAFGPLDPFHWLFEALPSLIINTRNTAIPYRYICSISTGCSPQ